MGRCCHALANVDNSMLVSFAYHNTAFPSNSTWGQCHHITTPSEAMADRAEQVKKTIQKIAEKVQARRDYGLKEVDANTLSQRLKWAFQGGDDNEPSTTRWRRDRLNSSFSRISGL